MSGDETETLADLVLELLRARVRGVVFSLPPVEIPPEEELLARIRADTEGGRPPP